MSRYKSKGITLVELIMVLAIFSVVLSIAYSFFISNYKSLNNAQSEVEYQSQGQKAIDKIVNVAMQSKRISSIELGYNPDGTSTSVKSITFQREDITETIKLYENEELYYIKNNNEEDKIEVAKGIKYIGVSSIPSNTDLFQAEGIRIIIKLGQDKSLETEVYFRNKR
ncbi:prepilin-type N-terminal cleavage/methylation domain-containing protein [Clostridium bovifaecis]|uniref:Prepilin-type N-terminal cleavage/methylation domain-containing protein n=1 Tax=Clostridium bovifaecis TaxID=2184719 RepID=A0A6I6F5K3_9CLOT|nr:prepilin-type N-terminal cleavage/methylation domain-containing protein [Clostridium bovifaecis]